MAQTHMDAYEVLDTFAAQGDVASLRREINRNVPKWAQDGSGLMVGLFEDPEKLDGDVRQLMNRTLEHGTLNEETFYALLALSELAGFERVRGAVHHVAYHSGDHPNRLAALRALRRAGDDNATLVLQQIEKAGMDARSELLKSLGHDSPVGGIIDEREWKLVR